MATRGKKVKRVRRSRAWQVYLESRWHKRTLSEPGVAALSLSVLEAACELAERRRVPRTAVRMISLSLIGDREMRVLNREYRGKDKATDVLSFCQNEGDVLEVSPLLGDLVISIDTTYRQAKEYGVTPDEELLRLLIHGTLHLLGYDHEKVSKAEAQKMRRLEDRLMTRLASTELNTKILPKLR